MLDEGYAEAAWHSDIGSRDTQEDSLRISEHHLTLLATVCDGMGGFDAGEVASRTAIGYLHDRFEETPYSDCRFFKNVLEGMDAAIYDLKDAGGRRLGTGTTVASVMLSGRRLYYLSVGDSRVYLLRSGELVQTTRDHNYGEELLDLLAQERITQAQFEAEALDYDGLTSYIGMGGVALSDCNEEPVILRDGDVLLVTSDGLYNAVPIETITQALSESTAVEATKALLRELAAHPFDPRDNTSFIVIRYHMRPNARSLT